MTTIKDSLLSLRYWTGTRISRSPLSLFLQRPVVTITFDDAPASAWTEGRSILDHFDGKATFYVSAGLGIQSLSYLQENHLREIIASRHEIGCHTYDHLLTARCLPSRMMATLDRNQDYFETRLGYRLENFAYPGGSIGFWNKSLLTGRFRSLRTNFAGVNYGTFDGGMLKACALYSDSVKHKNVLKFLDEAERRVGWLIFYTHDVSERPSRYGCVPRLLEFVLLEARRRKMDVLSVRDALVLDERPSK